MQDSIGLSPDEPDILEESEDEAIQKSGKLLVAKNACKNCLFTSNRLINPQTAKQILEETLEADKYFACHNSGGKNPELICCHNFFKVYGCESLSTRLAIFLQVVEEVTLEESHSRLSYQQMAEVEAAKPLSQADREVDLFRITPEGKEWIDGGNNSFDREE